jgi:integrase
MMAAGAPTEKVVAEILGHSSPVITQTIYQDILPGMGEETGAHLTRLLSQR